MSVLRQEIEERWLGAPLAESDVETVLEAFNRVEQLLGRPWLDAPAASGVVGLATMLPIYSMGQQLAILERATGSEKLIRRLRALEPVAASELRAMALCAPDASIEVDIAPTIALDRGEKVPDFRVRGSDGCWIYVEVTQPRNSDSANIAQMAAGRLEDVLPTIPDGMEVQVRFRDEPTDGDVESVRGCIANVEIGDVIDQPRFIIHAIAATPVLSPIGQDEMNRPIFGNAVARIAGDKRALISVRVPYTDARAQQVIDTEARQLPKEGPSLICILTHHEKYWKSLIECSFTPTIRRRISAVLLFQTGITLGTRGIELQTAGRLLANPHARTPLPPWLVEHLSRLPEAIGTTRYG